MGNWLTLKFWIETRPSALIQSSMIAIAAIIGALLVMAIFFMVIKNRRRNLYNKIWQKLYTFSISNFAIGFFLLFFSYEMIPFLSMRLWYLLWLAGMLAWLYFILRLLKEIPAIKEKIAKEKEYQKYIP